MHFSLCYFLCLRFSKKVFLSRKGKINRFDHFLGVKGSFTAISHVLFLEDLSSTASRSPWCFKMAIFFFGAFAVENLQRTKIEFLSRAVPFRGRSRNKPVRFSSERKYALRCENERKRDTVTLSSPWLKGQVPQNSEEEEEAAYGKRKVKGRKGERGWDRSFSSLIRS